MPNICPHCSVALMYPHETLHEYDKCEFCGFCQKKTKQGWYGIMEPKYITMEEYLGGGKLEDLSPELQGNANTIVPLVNELLSTFGQFRGVTSGLRTLQHHLEIYKKINDVREKKSLPPVHVPMSSKHLSAQACDLEDSDGKLFAWAKVNAAELARIGLWCEDGTVGWLHVQCVQYGSWAPGKSRFFTP